MLTTLALTSEGLLGGVFRAQPNGVRIGPDRHLRSIADPNPGITEFSKHCLQLRILRGSRMRFACRSLFPSKGVSIAHVE
jgi:hypothetical protein